MRRPPPPIRRRLLVRADGRADEGNQLFRWPRLTHPSTRPSIGPLVRLSAFPERRLARRIAVEGRDPAYFPPNRRPATDGDGRRSERGDSVRGSENTSGIARGGRNARDIYVAAAAGEVCSMYCACNMARVVTALERAGIQPIYSSTLNFAIQVQGWTKRLFPGCVNKG